ncbi:4'-phosphopantetheinyl transferase [Cubamyces sp. BRFM 1775]|nr:4'-phosphopantetheinyl transferase [Cubamyces sp. BRFM 1775]
MGILGIGVDIVHVPRVLRLLERRTPAKLAHRILSEKELSVWNGLPSEDQARRTRYLAVRWGVKEAAYKAVYPAAHPTWKDFTFHSLSGDGSRKPFLECHLKERESLSWKFHTSVSHDGDYVFATVLVEAP